MLLLLTVLLACLSVTLSLYNNKINIILRNKYKSSSSLSTLYSNENQRVSLFEATEDEDEDTVNVFKSIASNYLFNKFCVCRG